MANLRDITRGGDVQSLRGILAANPAFPLADKKFTSFLRTPLHIAAMLGYVEFARLIVNSDLLQGPLLAMVVDSQGFTPLHLASTRNNVDMVRMLVTANPAACLVQDKDGRTPLHLAATRHEVEIMELLIQSCPRAIHLRLLNTEETILHLCVKHNNFRGLEKLVNYLVANMANLNNPAAMISVDSVDIDGNTILHLVAKKRRMKMLKYLLESDDIGVDINIRNTTPEKLRALDMLDKHEMNDLEIGCYDYYNYSPRKVPQKSNHEEQSTTSSTRESRQDRLSTIIIVATLIAGIAFQAGVNPPGGVFQDDTKIDSMMDPVMFTYYLKNVIGTPMSKGFQSFLNNLPPQKTTRGNITADEIIIYRANFVNDLIIAAASNNDSHTTPYMSQKRGIVLEEDRWMKITSNYNSTYGGASRFSPYLIRYAGNAILAYTSPKAYESYLILNSFSFLLCVIIIIIIIVGSVGELPYNAIAITSLEVSVAISVGCIGFSYFIALSTITPPFYVSKTLLTNFGVTSIGVLLALLIASYIYSYISLRVRNSYIERLYRFRLQRYAHLPSFKRFIFGIYPRFSFILKPLILYCLKAFLIGGVLLGIWVYVSIT